MSANTMSARHLVVMAAGTGGHVMPGLAVAAEMQRRGWSVSWIGTEAGMENKLVPAQGIALDRLAFSGMRGKGFAHFFTGGLRMLGAMFASLGILRRRQPAVVFGTGGYVCVPAGLMAKVLRRPLVLLNADAALLMSNRFLAPLAKRVVFGFPGQYERLGERAVWSGNPVRPGFAALEAPTVRYAKRQGPLRILVVGGSLGAMVLNETVPKALAQLPAETRPLVVHQSGARHADLVRAAYAEAGVDAQVLPFIDDMAGCCAEADLVICRAGAITVSELCAGGVPSVLVPLKVSTTSHQEDNARFMAQAQAAWHLPQTEFTPERLARLLSELTRTQLADMGERARTLAKPDAAKTVADLLERVAR